MRRARIVMLPILLAGVIATGAARGYGQTTPLPPGHPSTGAPQPGAGSGGSQELTWTSPPGWTKETPSSSMRRAQYRITGADGPAECVVFYFGPGQGGDVQSNVARWGEQFRRPDGKPVGDALKTRAIKAGDIPVVLVEVTGTYVGGMGGGPAGPERPNAMLLGAIAEGPDGKWFFRATGPRTTLEAQRTAFERMIRSLKRAPGR